MKTFKLISLQIVSQNGDLVEIELTEGLSINKEEQNRWLIEAFVCEEEYHTFNDAVGHQDRVEAKVVITKKDNSPVMFNTEVLTIKKIENYYSILLEGFMVSTRSGYSEKLLEYLVDKGLTGDELMAEFKDKMSSKPKIDLLKK